MARMRGTRLAGYFVAALAAPELYWRGVARLKPASQSHELPARA